MNCLKTLIIIVLVLLYSNINCFNPFQQLSETIQNLIAKNDELAIPEEKFEFDRTVISIAHIVKKFDKSSSCQIESWNNIPESACKCCLVKHAPELDSSKQPENLLQICLENKECNENIIQNLLKEQNINYKNKNKSLLSLITNLYDKSIIIKEVSSKDIQFNNDGSFTPNSLINFLNRAYNEHKLLNSDFMDISCLKATNIMKEKGFATKQLFLVSSNCNGKNRDYIFKEGTGGIDEIIRLQKSLLIPELAPYLFPHEIKNFPSFILPEAYVSYKFKNQNHDLALMIRAPGIILSSLIMAYKNKAISKANVAQAFYEAGLSLSNFHKKFMSNFKDKAIPDKLLNPTYIHGDAHQANIFYDKASNQIIFIDNERIEQYPKDPFIDIQYIFLMTLKLFTPQDIKNDKMFINNWLSLTFEHFLYGYINAYDPYQRKQLLDEIIYKFNHSEEYQTPHNLYEVYQNYKQPFNSVFELLKKKYN